MIYLLLTYFLINLGYTIYFLYKSFGKEYKEDKMCAIFMLLNFMLFALPLMIWVITNKEKK